MPAPLTPAQRDGLATLAAGARIVPKNGRARQVLSTLASRGLVDVVGGRFTANERGRQAIARSSRARRGPLGPSKGRAKRVASDRWEYAQTLRDAGWSLEAIGDVLGVTGERVRQKTRRTRARPGSSSPLDPVQLVAIVRRPDMTSLAQLMAETGHADDFLRECLDALGMWSAVKRLFRWRRTAPTRRKYAVIIRGLADRLGRTPTLREIGTALGVSPTASAPILTNVFGGTRAAMAYAGCEPRPRGGPGHRDFGGLRTHCRRGHPYRWPPNGKPYCPTCVGNRYRERAA